MNQFKMFFGVLEKLQSANVHVYQDRCAVVRNRHASCTRCADACTSGCISYADNVLTISPEKCIGCGTCATVCPTCAIESENPTDAELFQSTVSAMRAADGVAIIACERMLQAAKGLYDPDKVSSVVCLGRVDESLIALMALAGGKKVVLVKGACEQCEHCVGLDTAELVCETANKLLEVWNNPLRAEISDRFPKVAKLDAKQKKPYDESRRAFFRGVKDDAKVAVGTIAEYAVNDALGRDDEPEPAEKPAARTKVNDAGVLPQHIPTRRKRLLKVLSEMGEPQDVVIETRLWGHVVIDKTKCKSCQMCATFCPTGALTRFKDKDGTVGVMHYPGCCVKCRCCTDICPNDALTISDKVYARDLMHGNVEKYPMDPPELMDDGVHQTASIMQKMSPHSQVSIH